MVELDFTALVFALSFILFIGLMQLVFFTPVANKIHQRENEINRDKDKSKSLVQEIQERIAKFKDDPEVLAARREAHDLINQAKSEASEAKSRLVTETSTELKAYKTKQTQVLESERNQVIKNLEGPIKEITGLMVGKLVSGASIKLKEELKV